MQETNTIKGLASFIHTHEHVIILKDGFPRTRIMFDEIIRHLANEETKNKMQRV
jgi:hypothetical protein